MAITSENRKMRSCIWLINLLQKKKELSLKEINGYWLNEKDLSRGITLSRQSFNDYLHFILDIFGIVISCRRKGGYKYYIEVDGQDFADWLLSSFSLGQLANEAQEVRNRVLLEAAPRGMDYFSLIVDALHNHCCLRATYHKFDNEPYTCHLRPYALKMFDGRWYILAEKDEEGRLKTFALDRFEGEMTLLRDEEFTPPRDFDAAEYFANCFGIFTDSGPVPLIKLRAIGTEVQYLRTKPLHPSQQQDPDDPSIFTIRCYATRDLMYAILSHGQKLTVLEPADFREKVRAEVAAIAEHYRQ